jgi:hypothetical protein
MEHIDWVDPDNIIIANSSSDYSYKKMISDVQKNGVTEVRLLRRRISKRTSKSYFRYIVGDEISWFYLSNDESRKGSYYTHIYPIDEVESNELNSLYRAFDREDKLNPITQIKGNSVDIILL